MKSKILAVLDAAEPSRGFLKKIAGEALEIVKTSFADFKAGWLAERPDGILLIFGKGGAGKIVGWTGEVRASDSNIPVVVLSPNSHVATVVAAVKKGATGYFSPPYAPDRVRRVIQQAVRTYQITRKAHGVESQSGFQGKFDDIVGVSQAMQEIFKMITMVAKSQSTVLIAGDSGTGKELVAKALHHHSDRASGKFIDINCGAIPRELLENELFGHERGAFTGADRRYIGSCERADGGTLFLDEVSEMDPALQVKLLRVLQERSFSRVGGSEKVAVDIRIIAATNRDLKKEVEKGTFREDLFYRLNVVPIYIPPLRERREDIASLAEHFLILYSQRNHKAFSDFEPEVMEAFVNYDWQGNVRELENTIERIVVLNNDTVVRIGYLPRFIQKTGRMMTAPLGSAAGGAGDQKILPLSLVERYAIESAIQKCSGDIVEAAQKLKIGQATLYRRLKRYGFKLGAP